MTRIGGMTNVRIKTEIIKPEISMTIGHPGNEINAASGVQKTGKFQSLYCSKMEITEYKIFFLHQSSSSSASPPEFTGTPLVGDNSV